MEIYRITLSTIIIIVSKNDDINVTFSESVQNDTTSNWRLAAVSTTKKIQEYALEYYHSYFQSDHEIHAIVNFTRNTTKKYQLLLTMLILLLNLRMKQHQRLPLKILKWSGFLQPAINIILFRIVEE